MKDNIRPDHYRKGEIDLYEAFSQIFPHNEYRAGMQMIAMRYMFRDKNDRVEDLKKAIYSLERLKEKEIEYKEAQEKEKALEKEIVNLGEALRSINTSENIHKQGGSEPDTVKPKTAGQYWDEIYFEHADLLKRLWKADYLYLARDENGELYAFEGKPKKYDDMDFWDTGENDSSLIKQDNFPEVEWTDDEPTRIDVLLAFYQNGGENGK